MSENDQKFVITIGRERGSGGRTVGKELAQRFHIAYFDREILSIASKELDVDEEFLSSLDERSVNLLQNVFQSPYTNLSFHYLPTEAELIGIQTRLIREFAQSRSCVIVGRCADYILRNETRCINIFLHSQLDERIEHIAKTYKISLDEARKTIKKMDTDRAKYYRSVTNQDWSDARNYHLSLNTSLLGIARSCDLIEEFVQRLLAK